jgi:hypothetical protein
MTSSNTCFYQFHTLIYNTLQYCNLFRKSSLDDYNKFQFCSKKLPIVSLSDDSWSKSFTFTHRGRLQNGFCINVGMYFQTVYYVWNFFILCIMFKEYVEFYLFSYKNLFRGLSYKKSKRTKREWLYKKITGMAK